MTEIRRGVIRLLAVVAIAAALFCNLATAETNSSFSGYLPLRSTASSGISDLVLIYQGGVKRPEWTAEQFAPYVSYRNAMKEEWLFDGFLFLEIRDGRGHQYANGYKDQPARKEDWLWLLDRNFETNRALDALEQAVAATAKRIGLPPTPRRVVLCLPEPIRGQKDWGEIGGRSLDFDKEDDRVAACAWHIETAMELWRRFAPKHLELAGFYWVAENSGGASSLLPRIKSILQAQGKKFFWIPYWQSKGAGEWQKLGFDAAYQQPNHFFHPEVADSRLDAACAFARANGLGMEFECDGRAIKSADVFRPRLHAYLEAFERNGVLTNSAVAYYEGGGALGQMASSTDKATRELYDAVARWVIRRGKVK